MFKGACVCICMCTVAEWWNDSVMSSSGGGLWWNACLVVVLQYSLEYATGPLENQLSAVVHLAFGCIKASLIVTGQRIVKKLCVTTYSKYCAHSLFC